MMTIYCIDDLGEKWGELLSAWDAVRDLKTAGLLNLAPPHTTGEAFDANAFGPASIDVEYVIRALKDPGSVIIFLDLGGVGDDSILFGQILRAQNADPSLPTPEEIDKACMWGNQEQTRHLNRYKNCVFICLAAQKFGKMVVNFSSELGSAAKTFSSRFNLVQVGERSETRTVDVANLLRRLASPANGVLRAFFGQYYLPNKKVRWDHNLFEDDDEIRNEVNRAFNLPDQERSKLAWEDAKALFEVNINPRAGWSPHIRPSPRTISSAHLKAAINALGFPCTPVYKLGDSTSFRLPFSPGALFLVSLKQLVDQIYAQSAKTADAGCTLSFERFEGIETKVVGKFGTLYRASVRYGCEDAQALGLAWHYLEKSSTSGLEKGVCGAVRKVVVGGLEPPAFTEGSTGELAARFSLGVSEDGTFVDVVWLSLVENGIDFLWI